PILLVKSRLFGDINDNVSNADGRNSDVDLFKRLSLGESRERKDCRHRKKDAQKKPDASRRHILIPLQFYQIFRVRSCAIRIPGVHGFSAQAAPVRLTSASISYGRAPRGA